METHLRRYKQLCNPTGSNKIGKLSNFKKKRCQVSGNLVLRGFSVTGK